MGIRITDDQHYHRPYNYGMNKEEAEKRNSIPYKVGLPFSLANLLRKN